MSVNIVTTPKVSTAPAAPDTAAGDATSGDDFADVLLGQLALGAAAVPLATGPVPALPAASSASDDDGKPAEARADAAFDATSLFVTMALVTPPVNGDATQPATDSGESTRGTALPTSASLLGKPVIDEAATRVDESPRAAPTSEAPAKFAVTAPAVTDTIGSGRATSESNSGESAALPTENMHAAGHIATNRHPTHSESTLAVNTPVRDADWAGDFGQKIVWLATSDTQSAELTLNPPQIGPIEVSLSVEGGHASVSFASANAEVRDAIETALPRLREMLASAGIELGQTNVGAESFRQQQQAAWTASGASRSSTDSAILAADSAVASSSRAFVTQRGNSLVDLFA